MTYVYDGPPKPRIDNAERYLQTVAGMHPEYKALTDAVVPHRALVIWAIDTAHNGAKTGTAFVAIKAKVPAVAAVIQDFCNASGKTTEQATRVLFGVGE